MTLTPGAYLRACRSAAGLSVEDIADRVATEPRQSAIVRADWLKSVEADIAPLSVAMVAVLSAILPIDAAIVVELEQHRLGIVDATTPLCTLCGTTDRARCGYPAGTLCIWTGLPPRAGEAA